jgi:RNA polymerase sigma-70 factor (ECF subfamily)
MTNAISPDHALYWSDSLAEELLQFLTRRLRCPDTAAEITHETFIRFCRTSQAAPVNNARALAYRIALNLAVDYQRKAKVRNTRAVDVDFEEFTDSFQSTEAGPEQIAIAQQNLTTLEQALMELPPDCRNAFLWRGIDGLTYLEIAARLGISESMVHKHLTRATAHCTQRMKESG